jgi:hypothetical protein
VQKVLFEKQGHIGAKYVEKCSERSNGIQTRNSFEFAIKGDFEVFLGSISILENCTVRSVLFVFRF